MSDSAIINDCIVHYDSRHIQVRKDYMDICVYDKSKFNQRVNSKGNRIKDEPNQECMAKILRLLETLTDDHRKEWFTRATKAKNKGLQVPEMPKEVYLELTYGGVCSLLYDTYGDSTVRNSVAVLLDRNFIKRRQKTNNSIPQYALNIEVVQAALIQREQDILSGVLKSTATRKHRKNKAAVENNSQASEINSQQPDFNSQASEINTNNIYSNNYLNKQDKKEENALSSTDETRTLSRPLVFHPLHDFIALDDAIAPKEIIVFMTPEKYFSEYEDKRREHIASEVHYELQQRGHHVTFKWEQEPESNYKFAPEVVDAPSPTNSPSSIETPPRLEETFSEQRDTTQASSEQSAPSEPALPEFAPETQEKATGQGNEQSTKQEALLIVEDNTGKTTSGNGKKATAKPVKPAKPELTTEFANDDERAMWERLDTKERAFYVRMNTQERALYAQWCSLSKARPTLGEAMFNACRKLAPANPTAEMMKQIRIFCFTIDKKSEKYPKGYYRTVGVHLWDIAEKAPDWETVQEQAQAQQQTTTNSQKSDLAQETGITRPELYRPAEDNNPRREAALNRQWIDPKKRNRRTFGNEAS